MSIAETKLELPTQPVLSPRFFMSALGNEKQTVIESDPTGRYERTADLLGRGAYKEVYRAYDSELGVEVAWNQLAVGNLTEKTAQKILEEIRILQGLRCDYIIRFYHSWFCPTGRPDGSFQVYFITELMTSGTIKSFIRKTKTTIKTRVIRNWAKQILSGLHYLHTLDPPIIHRDLKCDNIFINGNNGQAKIGDFGLAIIKRRERECLSTVIGTPEFMAPELYDEHYDEKIDIYSFGMCVLELVTRDYPYSECENAAQIYRKVTNGIKPASLYGIEDKEVREFIELCIQNDYRKRPSAEDLMHHPFISFEVVSKEHEDASNLQPPSTLSSPTVNEPSSVDPAASYFREQEDKVPFSCNVQVTHYEYPTVEMDMVVACGFMACTGITKSRQIKFPLNIETETPQLIAYEMVKHDLVPEECMLLVEHEISNAASEYFREKSSSPAKNAEESGYEPDYEHSPCKSDPMERPRRETSRLQISQKNSPMEVVFDSRHHFKGNQRRESFSDPDLSPEHVEKETKKRDFPSDSEFSHKHASVEWKNVRELIMAQQSEKTPIKQAENGRAAAHFSSTKNFSDDSLHSPGTPAPTRSTPPPLLNYASNAQGSSLTPFRSLTDSPVNLLPDRNSHTLSFLETEFCNVFSSNLFNSISNASQSNSIINGSLQTKNKSTDLVPLALSKDSAANSSVDPLEFLRHKELEEFVISASSSSNSSGPSVNVSSLASPTEQADGETTSDVVPIFGNVLIPSDFQEQNAAKSNGDTKGNSNGDSKGSPNGDSMNILNGNSKHTSNGNSKRNSNGTSAGVIATNVNSLDLNQSLIDLDDSNFTLLPPLLDIPRGKCKSNIDLLDLDDIPDDAAHCHSESTLNNEQNAQQNDNSATKETLKNSFSLLDIK